MNNRIKLAMIILNRELERQSESHPDDLGLVEIPQILQQQCGFPRTVGELTLEQTVWIAASGYPEAFEKLERERQELKFWRLKPGRETKH